MKLFACRLKFILLINVKMPITCLHFNIHEQDKLQFSLFKPEIFNVFNVFELFQYSQAVLISDSAELSMT